MITDDDIAMAQAQRKGSYDDMDQEMGQPDQINSNQINTTKLESKLEDMFDNMQITVMGQNDKGQDSDDF